MMAPPLYCKIDFIKQNAHKHLMLDRHRHSIFDLGLDMKTTNLTILLEHLYNLFFERNMGGTIERKDSNKIACKQDQQIKEQQPARTKKQSKIQGNKQQIGFLQPGRTESVTHSTSMNMMKNGKN